MQSILIEDDKSSLQDLSFVPKMEISTASLMNNEDELQEKVSMNDEDRKPCILALGPAVAAYSSKMEKEDRATNG